ncbi:hypothetical protein APHAL10511_000854 [Amanita phalloides]|nr:hypothetical protein APHAL10511_000854 [Amanita phalloides]
MPPVAFAGGLQQKKKSELQEIAIALKISDSGTRDVLQARIRDYLEGNQKKLGDNPKFAGLYPRRRKSVQAQPEHQPHSMSSPNDADAKSPFARVKNERRPPALEPISEPVPAADASPRKAVLSTPELTPTKSPKVSKDETEKSASRLPHTPVKTVATPVRQRLGIPQTQMGQADVLKNGSEMLILLRNFLSNSRNIWSLTAIVELLYIVVVIIPWKAIYLPLASNISLPIFYPPLQIFQTQAFWLVLLHWFIPTLLVPAIVGNLISFTPGANAAPMTPTRASSTAQIVPFDPLTASIVRLAAEIAYPYTSIETRRGVVGLDVVGFRWRVLHASIGLAFAFAEAIAGAPQAFAKTLEQRFLKPFQNGETRASPAIRKVIAGDETLVQ